MNTLGKRHFARQSRCGVTADCSGREITLPDRTNSLYSLASSFRFSPFRVSALFRCKAPCLNKISCLTSFHSQNAHAVGGYLYLLFNLLPSYLVAYLSTFIDKIATNIKQQRTSKRPTQHIYRVNVTKLAPNIVCGRGCETKKFVYVA